MLPDWAVSRQVELLFCWIVWCFLKPPIKDVCHLFYLEDTLIAGLELFEYWICIVYNIVKRFWIPFEQLLCSKP